MQGVVKGVSGFSRLPGAVPVDHYFSRRIFSVGWLLVICFSRVVVCGVLALSTVDRTVHATSQ